MSARSDTIPLTGEKIVTLIVTFWRRWYDMIWLRKTETYLGVVEFFFSLEEGKDA